MVKLVLSYTFQPQKVMPEISQWRVELDLLVSEGKHIRQDCDIPSIFFFLLTMKKETGRHPQTHTRRKTQDVTLIGSV